ncbi:MAG: hypothetical protein WA755_13550 [Candidatus Acidiferrales bacterium]
MKTDRAALLWGTVIAIAFVVGTGIVVFKFPNFRLPFSVTHGAAFVACAALFLLLIASYRKLWKRPGFWVLLLSFLGVYWLLVVYIAEEVGGLRMDVLYGVTGAVEVAIFAFTVARVYHQGPDVPSWIGLGSR